MTRKNHFIRFEQHTLVKHFLLDSYLKAWATILVGVVNRVGKFRQIWFVDAFAGAGGDEHEHPGSPVIAAQIARDVNATRFPGGIGKGRGMRILAFETDEDFFPLLVGRMKDFTECDPWIAQLRHFSLDTKIDDVVGYLQQDPALYFLDPFGVAGLSADVVKRIFEGDHNEVLALFCDGGAVRLAGKARAGEVDPGAMEDAAEAAARMTGSLFGEEDLAARAQEARDKARRSAAGSKSNPDAQRIMDVAFGGNWWQPIIEETPEDRRDEMLVRLYERVLRERGAKYVLRFEVRTDEGRRKYYLVHGSKSASAYVAMKDAMHRTWWRQSKEEGLLEIEGPAELLGVFAASSDVHEVAREVAEHFAGEAVRWASNDRATATARTFALAETPLWMHECKALQKLLLPFAKKKPNGTPISPITYEFPPKGT